MGVTEVVAGFALEYIEALYGHEARLRQQGLADAAKLAYRGEYAKPVVEAFFLWLRQTLTTQGCCPLIPSPRPPATPWRGSRP